MPVNEPKRSPGRPSKGGRPPLAPGRKKVSVTLYLAPATLDEIDGWLESRPELAGRSAVVTWALRVASEVAFQGPHKGGTP